MIYVGAVVLAIAMLAIVLVLLLRRSLREKYAALWLIIGTLILIVGLVPSLLTWVTRVLGFELPANLVFTLTLALLLGVALHLSSELTRQEAEVRRLAEETAIARLRLDEVERRLRAEDRNPPDEEIAGED